MITITFDGLLFDLDGTLIDSSKSIDRAWGAFALKYKINVDELLRAIQGKPARESVCNLRPAATKNEVDEDTKWLETMESNDTDGVIALPGTIELLNNLNKLTIPWSIVTSGTLPVATARIKAANLPFPKVLVTPEQVEHGKPDPEPYLLGARQLGLDIKKCVVFEDAPAGVESGNRAGAKTVGVLTQFKRSDLIEKNVDVCIDTLLDVGVSSDDGQYFLSVNEKV